MPNLPKVGVEAVVEGAKQFASDARNVNDAYLAFAKSNTTLKNANKDAVSALQTFGVNLNALNSPLTLIASGLKSSIDFTTQWGDTIDEITRITGTSARESSKLAIVLGDVGISTNSLKGAAKALRSQGLVPSLDTLKELAVQYQSIQDPVARNDFLFKKLGRSGLELSEFLSRDTREIDALGAAAEKSGKIIDEAGINRAEQYKQKLAQLGDQLDGAKLAVGSFAVEILDKAIPAGQQYIGIWQALAVKAQLATGIIDQNTATIKAAEIAGLSHEQALRQVYAAEMDVTDASDRQAASLAYTAVVTEQTTTESINYADASRSATEALAALQARQDGWAATTGQAVISALNEAGVEGDQYLAALVAIDAQLGTGFANEEETKNKLAAITEEFKKTGDVDAYKSSLAALYEDSMPRAIQSFDDFTGRSEALAASLNRIPRSIDVVITQTLHEQGVGGMMGGYQHGGDFIVPPGYQNDTYRIGVSSGERVVVIPQRGGGSTTNQTNWTYSPTYGGGAPPSVGRDFAVMQALAG